MVKVIIQTEKETIIKEGDFILGSVLRADEEGYGADGILIGWIDREQFPHIVTEVALGMLEQIEHGDALGMLSSFAEFKEYVDEGVAERVKARKEDIFSSLYKLIDKVKGSI